jgi:Ser/Thr protein kinase RdoA (MazF antagonist)
MPNSADFSETEQEAELSALVKLVQQRYRTTIAVASAFYHEREKAVFRLDREAGHSWVARIFPRSFGPERIEGDAAVLGLMARAGIPAERVVPAADGSRVASMDGRGVLVTRFIPGSPPKLTPAVLRSLGEIVGRMHALPAVAGAGGYLSRRAAALPRDDLDFGLARLASVAGRVPDPLVAQYEELQAALLAADGCEQLPFRLVHLDCQPGNVLRTPGGRLVLFDWDGAGQGPAVAALGVLLYGCAFGSVAGRPAPPDITRVDAVLAGYSARHWLSAAELDHLGHAIRFRPLAIAARELAAAIERGETVLRPGWWSGWQQSDEIAARARQAAEATAAQQTEAKEIAAQETADQEIVAEAPSARAAATGAAMAEAPAAQ